MYDGVFISRYTYVHYVQVRLFEEEIYPSTRKITLGTLREARTCVSEEEYSIDSSPSRSPLLRSRPASVGDERRLCECASMRTSSSSRLAHSHYFVRVNAHTMKRATKHYLPLPLLPPIKGERVSSGHSQFFFNLSGF